MGRATFNPGEIDQNFQIEDGIRETLRMGATATVRAVVIQDSYDLLDEDCSEVVGATLEAKCHQIAQELGVDFSVRRDRVVFRRKQEAMQHTGPGVS